MPKRNLSGVDYKESTVPEDYKCTDCGVHGVRLWREYQTFADHTDLQCADCAEASQLKSHEPDWESPFKRGKGDSIGWRIPAVPVEGEDTYWGYSSVPEAGGDWWHSLPTRLTDLDSPHAEYWAAALGQLRISEAVDSGYTDAAKAKKAAGELREHGVYAYVRFLNTVEHEVIADDPSYDAAQNIESKRWCVVVMEGVKLGTDGRVVLYS